MNIFTPTVAGADRRGFTLTELLIVIGLIIVLLAILLPVLGRVTGQGERTRIASELSAVATALDAYRNDHRDYPRFRPGTTDPLNVADDRGARLLARALFGVAPTNPPGAFGTGDELFWFRDGAGSPAEPWGFKRTRQNVSGDPGNLTSDYFPGETYGPYLEPGRFNLRRAEEGSPAATAGLNFGPDTVIQTHNNAPVLYYPGLPRPPQLTTAPGLVGVQNEGTSQASMYNAFDNRGQLAHANLCRILGVQPTGAEIGRVVGRQQPAHTGPFLLITTTRESLGGWQTATTPEARRNLLADVVVNFTPGPLPAE